MGDLMTTTDELCYRCGQAITLADDGAWCDSSGACGCGDDEHCPGGDGRDRIAENDPERLMSVDGTMGWLRGRLEEFGHCGL